MLSIQQGVVSLQGALSFQTVEALLPQGYEVLRAEPQVVFDLSQVTEVDSAGLALLIAWCRMAKKTSRRPFFRQIPASMKALMAVTNVESMLSEFLA